jgi:hypothetical protein
MSRGRSTGTPRRPWQWAMSQPGGQGPVDPGKGTRQQPAKKRPRLPTGEGSWPWGTPQGDQHARKRAVSSGRCLCPGLADLTVGVDRPPRRTGERVPDTRAAQGPQGTGGVLGRKSTATCPRLGPVRHEPRRSARPMRRAGSRGSTPDPTTGYVRGNRPTGTSTSALPRATPRGVSPRPRQGQGGT